MRVLRLLGATITLICSITCHAGSYGYYPHTPLHLGGSFSPQDPFTPLLDCITFTPTPLNPPPAQTSFEARRVLSTRDLYQEMHLSVRMRAEAAFFTANGDLEIDSSATNDENAVTWVLRAYTNFGTLYATNADLNVPAKDLLRAKKWDKFVARCGTEIVTQEERGVAVIVVYKARRLDSRTLDSVNEFFSADASVPLVSAELRQKYQAFVSQLAMHSEMEMSVYLLGGEGIQKLANLIDGKDDIDTVSGKIKDYAASFSFSNATPLNFGTTPLTAFGWPGPMPDIARRNDFLDDLLFIRNLALESKNRLQQLVAMKSDSPMAKIISSEQAGEYRRLYDQYSELLGSIDAKANACKLNDYECKGLSAFKLPTVSWPATPKPPQIVLSTFESKPWERAIGMYIDRNYERQICHIYGHDFHLAGEVIGNPDFFVSLQMVPTCIGCTKNASIPVGPWKKNTPIIEDLKDKLSSFQNQMLNGKISSSGSYENLMSSGDIRSVQGGVFDITYSYVTGDDFDEITTPMPAFPGFFREGCDYARPYFPRAANSIILYATDIFGSSKPIQIWPQ